jgi:hypothetical protein
MIASSGRSALVHFADERTKVVTVFNTPEVGYELDGDVPKGWIVDKVEARGGEEIEGQSISVEAWVHRAREYAVLLVHGDDKLVNGMHVYRGEGLPDVDQFITVETALSSTTAPPMSRRARVTRVIPDDAFPVRAVWVGEFES